MRVVCSIALLTALAGCVSGCEPEFEPYNELHGTRVLAVRAESPDLAQGERTTIDALIHHADGQPLQRRWSLCPWPSDPDDGFTCPLDQAQFQAVWRAAGLTGSAPALSLGTAETSTVAFPGTADEARALCGALNDAVHDALLPLPDCTRRWEWTVRLSLSSGDTQIEAIKTVGLLLDRSAPNHNPTLSGLSVERDGERVRADGEAVPVLDAGGDYDLFVSLAKDATEMYVPEPALGQNSVDSTRETLTFTWFVDAGSTARMRTTYGDDIDSLHDASRNTWLSPHESESGLVHVYVVVRDHRGGVGFRAGRVRLK